MWADTCQLMLWTRFGLINPSIHSLQHQLAISSLFLGASKSHSLACVSDIHGQHFFENSLQFTGPIDVTVANSAFNGQSAGLDLSLGIIASWFSEQCWKFTGQQRGKCKRIGDRINKRTGMSFWWWKECASSTFPRVGVLLLNKSSENTSQKTVKIIVAF